MSWSRYMIVLLVVTNRRMVASTAQLARTIFRRTRRPITGMRPAAEERIHGAPDPLIGGGGRVERRSVPTVHTERYDR